MSGYQPSRDFRRFLGAAITGLSPADSNRVALALDIAVAFGILEHADGNPSLQSLPMLAAAYAEKLGRLEKLAAASPAPAGAPSLPPLFAALEAELVQQLGAETVAQIKQTVTRHFDELVQSLMAIEPRAPTVN